MKGGEYVEFFYLLELVCNSWQVMLSVVKPHNTSGHIVYVIKLDSPRIDKFTP